MAGLSAIGCRLRATFVNEAGNMANQTHNQHHGHGQQKKKKAVCCRSLVAVFFTAPTVVVVTPRTKITHVDATSPTIPAVKLAPGPFPRGRDVDSASRMQAMN